MSLRSADCRETPLGSCAVEHDYGSTSINSNDALECIGQACTAAP